MGKVIFIGVLVLAVAPTGVTSAIGTYISPTVLREASREEAGFEAELAEIHEDFGTNCIEDLNGEAYNEYGTRVQKLNMRRAYQRRVKGLGMPEPYPTCGDGEGGGYPT